MALGEVFSFYEDVNEKLSQKKEGCRIIKTIILCSIEMEECNEFPDNYLGGNAAVCIYFNKITDEKKTHEFPICLCDVGSDLICNLFYSK